MIDVDKLKKAMVEDMKAFFQTIAEDDSLMMSGNWKNNPRRTHYSNTIKDSNAVKDTEFANEGNIFKIAYPDYLEYVDYGRKPNGKLPPFDAILNWCKEKGLPTDNNVVWAIMQNIKTFGIKRRRIIAIFINHSDYLFDNMSEKLFNEITKELDKYFN